MNNSRNQYRIFQRNYKMAPIGECICIYPKSWHGVGLHVAYAGCCVVRIKFDVQAEFAAQREETVRALSDMIFSWDQNGHLFMRKHDISILVSAVELLNRVKAK